MDTLGEDRTLTFWSFDLQPPGNGARSSPYRSALLLNACDGYHSVYARYDSETGEFEGFYDWIGRKPYVAGLHFCAWALLPEEAPLIERFREKEATDTHPLIAQKMADCGWSPELDEALATCPDAECADCARIVCPSNDPHHFHHDGCPSCDQEAA